MAATPVRPRLTSAGARIYYAAIFLCPPAFRREFSAEMARDVDAQVEEVRRSGGAVDRAVLCARLSADLAVTLIVQWLRSGFPALAACALAAAFAATQVAASMLPHAALPVPLTAHDRDVMTLMLLTGTVLLVIVATIVFTFWFSRPAPRRRRR
jgi:hypothetical protein